MKPVIRVSLDLQTGKLHIDMEGFHGEGCLDLLKKLSAAFDTGGQTLTPKPEYFLPPATHKQEQTNRA